MSDSTQSGDTQLGRLMAQSWFGPLLAALLMFGFFALTGGSKGFLSVSGTAGWSGRVTGRSAAVVMGILSRPWGHRPVPVVGALFPGR